MQLYDSLRQQLVPIKLIDDAVRMYVCGITPYDTSHVGHARTYVVFDTLWRVLEWEGLPVIYVQNVTDIDDDILRKSAELGISWDELGRRETERFLRSMAAIKVALPDHYVNASDSIEQIIEVVRGLVDKGFAYERNGNVYFDIHRDPEFGALAHISDYDTLLSIANERGNYPDDPNKRDPLDFVLWQAQQPGEPAWDSPWGPGRPGWHIECTAMVLQYLGPHINIHGGGGDLQFPHHTCELAQAENYTGVRPHVDAWAHVGMVYYKGEKMSKSLGNLVLIDDLLTRFSSDAIRLALLRYHYRQQYEYSDDDVLWAEEVLQRIQAAVASGSSSISRRISALQLRDEAFAALDNDLDTPECLRLMIALAEASLNGEIDDAAIARRTLRDLGTVLGLSAKHW